MLGADLMITFNGISNGDCDWYWYSPNLYESSDPYYVYTQTGINTVYINYPHFEYLTSDNYILDMNVSPIDAFAYFDATTINSFFPT